MVTWNGQTFDPDQMINGVPAMNTPGTPAYQWNMAGGWSLTPQAPTPTQYAQQVSPIPGALATGQLSAEAQAGLAAGTPALNVPGTPEYEAEMRRNYVAGLQQQSIQTITSKMPKIDPYKPFAFDEAWAKEASTAEYTPYYQESLTNYVTDQETRLKREQQATTRGLGYITGQEQRIGGAEDIYKKQQALDYENAIKSAQEGFAGRGLTFSGIREKGEGDITQKYQLGLESYGLGKAGQMASLGYQREGLQTGLAQTGEDVQRAIERQKLETQRAQTSAIYGGVATRKGEAMDEYKMGMLNYYAPLMGTLGNYTYG